MLQLFGPAAKDCTMSVRIGGTLYVDLAAERTVHTLSATIRKRGTYVVNVRCGSVNRKAYELTAAAHLLGAEAQGMPSRGGRDGIPLLRPRVAARPACGAASPLVAQVPTRTSPRDDAHWLASNRFRTPSFR